MYVYIQQTYLLSDWLQDALDGLCVENRHLCCGDLCLHDVLVWYLCTVCVYWSGLLLGRSSWRLQSDDDDDYDDQGDALCVCVCVFVLYGHVMVYFKYDEHARHWACGFLFFFCIKTLTLCAARFLCAYVCACVFVMYSDDDSEPDPASDIQSHDRLAVLLSRCEDERKTQRAQS